VLGGEVVPYSEFDPESPENKIVVSVGAPSRALDGSKFHKLRSAITFVYWIDDMGWWNEHKRRDFENTLKRADIILCANPVKFSLLWHNFSAQHLGKHVGENCKRIAYVVE